MRSPLCKNQSSDFFLIVVLFTADNSWNWKCRVKRLTLNTYAHNQALSTCAAHGWNWKLRVAVVKCLSSMLTLLPLVPTVPQLISFTKLLIRLTSPSPVTRASGLCQYEHRTRMQNILPPNRKSHRFEVGEWEMSKMKIPIARNIDCVYTIIITTKWGAISVRCFVCVWHRQTKCHSARKY